MSKYLDNVAKASQMPRPNWSEQAVHMHANAVSEGRHLFNQFQVAKAKGEAEATGCLSLAVAEVTRDEVTQLWHQSDKPHAQLADNGALRKEVRAPTVMGAIPVDLSEQAASAQLAVNYAAQRLKQNQAKELRVHDVNERKTKHDGARAGLVESRNEVHKHYKAFREQQKEFDKQLTPLGQPFPKQPKVNLAAASGVLRSVDVDGAGFEAFNVTVTPDTTADELKEMIAKHLGNAAPTIDAMELMLGRKLLGAGTLGGAGVKDGVSLTLTKATANAKAKVEPQALRPRGESTGAGTPNGICAIYMKAVKEEFVVATAEGLKYFECTAQKGMFKRLQPGDLLILTQTQSHCRAIAVGRVAHAAISQETRRAALLSRVPDILKEPVLSYLGTAATFDYVQFDIVYDMRSRNMTCEELLGKGGFSQPATPWNGLLKAQSTTSSSAAKLLTYLSEHGVERTSNDGVDV
jgi:hypothetical protein